MDLIGLIKILEMKKKKHGNLDVKIESSCNEYSASDIDYVFIDDGFLVLSYTDKDGKLKEKL